MSERRIEPEPIRIGRTGAHPGRDPFELAARAGNDRAPRWNQAAFVPMRARLAGPAKRLPGAS